MKVENNAIKKIPLPQEKVDQLESLFLAEMLKPLGQSASIFSGPGEEQFQSFRLEQIARKISDRVDLGIFEVSR